MDQTGAGICTHSAFKSLIFSRLGGLLGSCGLNPKLVQYTTSHGICCVF